MSDLISRSALYDALIKCDGLGRKSCEAVVKVIKNQPTAYDVDKVVVELKKKKRFFHGGTLQEYYYGKGIDDAIEIVRKGGVEE